MTTCVLLLELFLKLFYCFSMFTLLLCSSIFFHVLKYPWGQETKGRSKEKERDKRRADAPRNGGDERSEKRRRGDDDAKKGDDDVVMISSHRPATGRSGAARNSLAVQSSHSDRDRSSRTVSSYGDRADRRPTNQYSRGHDRLDRRR